MTQLSLIVLSDPIFEAVEALIGGYVRRGDTLESLKDMGATSPHSYWTSVGGYMEGKKYGNNKILVVRDINGKIVNAVVDKKEAYLKIKEKSS